MNVSQKLILECLLGFVLFSLCLVAFLLAVDQQRTSYISLTQAHSPQKFVNLNAEEINGRQSRSRSCAFSPALLNGRWRTRGSGN